MILPFFCFTLLSALLASAQDWHFARYTVSNGSELIGLSGKMEVPKLPKPGVYYLWPGLQPSDSSGVYQSVLDGRSGQWAMGSGWCCAEPSLPWGDSFDPVEGDVVEFESVQGNEDWTSTLSIVGTDKRVTSKFPLADKSFNQAIFSVELYNVTWDFGPLKFSDITITAVGSTSLGWCNDQPENYQDTTIITVADVAPMGGDASTCTISSLTLEGPTGNPASGGPGPGNGTANSNGLGVGDSEKNASGGDQPSMSARTAAVDPFIGGLVSFVLALMIFRCV